MKTQNKLMQWIKSHTKQSICIAITIVLTVGFSIFMAVQVQPEPEAKAVTKEAIATVNKNVDTNEHISDETKESTKETTESAQSKTETKPAETVKPDNTGNTSTGNSSGNKSGSNTSKTKPNTSKSKERVWVPEQGHYEEVWVENMVLVEITPAKTEKVYDYYEYIFAYDGYTTTDEYDCMNHQKELIIQDKPENYTNKRHYKTVTTPAVTELQDQGKYEKKWVVDVPGHWE